MQGHLRYDATSTGTEMKVSIVYDSRTGTTALAASKMAEILGEQGHECTARRVGEADPGDAAGADLVCVGSWTQGLFVVLQHPTAPTMRYIDQLGDLTGKRAIVFCTYKLATGSTLAKMAAALRAKGAHVIGEFKFRGPRPTERFHRFARGV